MKLIRIHIVVLFAVALTLVSLDSTAQKIEIKASLINENRILNEDINLHLTDASTPLNNSTVNLLSDGAWLYFDNMKPSVVLGNYKSKILINGAVLNPNVNARVSMYKQGTVIVSHTPAYQPLQVFTETGFSGNTVQYSLTYYYSNAPDANVPSSLSRPLGEMDNSIRSFKLKKGYMATFANSSDGTGYSRIFIADTSDLEISSMPEQLDKKVSFIRVFKWNWVSKKGWCGGDQYAEAEANVVNATWHYTWGVDNVDTTHNIEFCPEKWGLSWPGWDQIFAKTETSHLLGYNEPDHTEQSNVSVDVAVKDWPTAMKTGMRLGAPATTNFDWLYQFMAQCNAKNYRVDYVPIHAYWGGKSPINWYNDLKVIHEKTGRPIWITEWNNGANWTNESWPSGTAAQQQKQLTDLTAILTVLDTASFIERYSIYNWVEDKRALILPASSTWTPATNSYTPAGIYYRDNKSKFAFTAKNEVIPGWKITEPPVLSYTHLSDSVAIKLTWTDNNGEMIDHYIIERKSNGGEFQEIGQIQGAYHNWYNDQLKNDTLGSFYYRVKSIGYDSTILLSNEVIYNIIKKEDIVIENLSIPTTGWILNIFNSKFTDPPVVVFGTPSYKNKFPMGQRIRDIQSGWFEFRITPWLYLQNPALVGSEQIAFISMPAGTSDLNGITAKAGVVKGVHKSWKQVSFDSPFNGIPVVFATQITSNTSPSSVRVRNVTTSGYEISLQYEAAITPDTIGEDVNFIAFTLGIGVYKGKKIIVGRTADKAVGDYFSPLTFQFGYTFNSPAFFGFMQTESDGIASTMRYSKLDSVSVKIFKQREISVSSTAVLPETVGWMVAETDTSTKIPTAVRSINYPANEISVYPNPVMDNLTLTGISAPTKVEIYNVLCTKVYEQTITGNIDVSRLCPGIYLLRVEGKKVIQFIKK